jgi:hypothetical protein
MKRIMEIIKPVLRGKDLDKYKIKFKNYYLINSHNGAREQNVAPIDINNYPNSQRIFGKLW